MIFSLLCGWLQDVCSYGDEVFPGDSEGDVHYCHGFTWANNSTDQHTHLVVQNFNLVGKCDAYVDSTVNGQPPG